MNSKVDSHLHLWDLSRGGYGWLTPQLGSLYASYLPDDAYGELSMASVDKAVLVQADNTRADTDYMLEVAEASPWVAAVVGWIPLHDPSAAMRELDRLQEAPKLRGVRQIAADPGFLRSDNARLSLSELAGRGYSLDVADSWPEMFMDAIEVARGIPDLTVVIDHLGKPPSPASHEFDRWRTAMKGAAGSPNIFMKVSGLTLPGLAFDGAALSPIWDTALEAFGSARLMYGGDWPISVPFGGYQRGWSVYNSLASNLSADERVDFFSKTAHEAYRL